MGNTLVFSFAICCASGLLFWIMWLPLQWAAIRLADDEFRAKGFMELPSGLGWFPFLLRKHYDSFENSRARLYFTISHVCAVGVILSVSAGILLVGCDLLLKLVS